MREISDATSARTVQQTGERAHPRHGWLAAVIPADARRFRVHDQDLATTLRSAGAELVETHPDVEIAPAEVLRGDARRAIVEVRVREPRGRIRAFRGMQRLAGSARIRRLSRAACSALRGRGYATVEVLTWERGFVLRPHHAEEYPHGRLAHRFPLNAVAVGSNAGEPTPFDASVVAAEEAAGRRLRPTGLLLGASGVIVARTPEGVLRVAIGPAGERLEEQREALAALSALEPPAVVANRVPWTMATGRCGLATWSLERHLAGDRPSPQLTSELLRDCLEFVAVLYETGRSRPARATTVDDAEIVATLCGAESARAVRRLGERLESVLARIPRGFGHGDFWTGNLLVEGDRLAGVVDWPGAGLGALPLLDLFHLKVNSVRELERLALGPALVDRLLPSALAGGDALDREYLARIGLQLDATELRALVAAYWLHAVAREVVDPDRDPIQPGDPVWRQENVETVLTAFDGVEGTAARGRAPSAAGRASTAGEEVVSTLAGVPELAREWRGLAERRANPFLTPDWYASWLRHCGAGSRPFIVTLRNDEEKLVGLMPLVVSTNRRLPIANFAGADFGDYFHPVAAEGADEERVAAATARTLSRRSSEWAIFVADYVDDGAPWIRRLVEDTGSRPFVTTQYHDRPSVYHSIPLDGLGWEDYLSTRSKQFREKLGRNLRRLEREHQTQFRCVTEPSEVGESMSTLFGLHDKRWRVRGGTAFANEPVQTFQVDFARAAAEHGWLRLWFLDVDGQSIAGWYGWRLGDKYLYYQSGFDPQWSRYSPGFVLLAHTIRSAIREEASEYDMLLGDETYKSRFAMSHRTARTLVLTGATHPARFVVAADVALRRLGRRLPPAAHRAARRAAEPLLRRWPVETAP